MGIEHIFSVGVNLVVTYVHISVFVPGKFIDTIPVLLLCEL